MIYVVGIGSGDNTDYLTLKAYRCLTSADVGIYIGEMIGEDKKCFSK